MLAGVATLREIEEAWSIMDLLDANEVLDLRERAEREAARAAERHR